MHEARAERYTTGTYCSDLIETYADSVAAWREFLTVLSPTSREVALSVSPGNPVSRAVCNVHVKADEHCGFGSLGSDQDPHLTLPAAVVRAEPDSSGHSVIVTIDIRGQDVQPGLYIGDLKVGQKAVADVYVEVSP